MSGVPGDLSPEQEAKLTAMKERMNEVFKDRTDETPLETFLRHDDSTYLRFLRARKFDLDAAVEMMTATAKWRREFKGIGVEAVTEEMCARELSFGKSYFYKYDKQDRPVTYIFPHLHIPAESNMEELEYCTIFCLETGRRTLRLPQERGCIVYDMRQWGLKNFDLQYMKFMIHVMGNFYPESLGQALVVGAPWLFYASWAVLKVMLDPVTQEKVKFINQADLVNFIDEESLPTSLGGKDPYVFEYVHPKDRAATGWKPNWEQPWVGNEKTREVWAKIEAQAKSNTDTAATTTTKEGDDVANGVDSVPPSTTTTSSATDGDSVPPSTEEAPPSTVPSE